MVLYVIVHGPDVPYGSYVAPSTSGLVLQRPVLLPSDPAELAWAVGRC